MACTSVSRVRVKLKRNRFTTVGEITRRYSTVANWLRVEPTSGQRGGSGEPRKGWVVSPWSRT